MCVEQVGVAMADAPFSKPTDVEHVYTHYRNIKRARSLKKVRNHDSSHHNRDHARDSLLQTYHSRPVTIYTLHMFPFSIHSIYIRFASVLGAAAHCPLSDAPVLGVRIDTKLVNLHVAKNLSDEFLKLNPKGQVPVLTGPGLPMPLTESVAIAQWLCQTYPKLLPAQHKSVIHQAINTLFSFDMLSLTTLEHDQTQVWFNHTEGILDVLQDIMVPSQHRRALVAKLERDDARLKDCLTPSQHERARRFACEFLDLVLTQRRLFGRGTTNGNTGSGQNMWIFGDRVGPTVLDAFAHPFIMHMRQFHQVGDLVPVELQEWAGIVSQSALWEEVMHGRRTLWSPLEDGPVDKFEQV